MINVADVGGAVDSWFNSAHVSTEDGQRVNPVIVAGVGGAVVSWFNSAHVSAEDGRRVNPVINVNTESEKFFSESG